MKKSYLLLAIPALLMAACKQPEAKTEAPTTATPNYPYKIKNPDYWLMDTSHTNTMIALKAIKAFETSDSVALQATLADSLEFNYDGGKFKGPSKEFTKMSIQMAGTMKGLKIEMSDWEGVVSKDGKEEWVTLWYTQKWTDAKGKADSVKLVNDLKMKAGKITRLDEYDMHFKPVKM
jgi:hypothetical protein